MRQLHGGGRMEEKKGRHSHALHGDEYSEECMQHNVKRKEKHEDSVAVICLSDKIKEKRKTTKSVETMLGVLSRNTTPSLKIDFQAIKRDLLGVKTCKRLRPLLEE